VALTRPAAKRERLLVDQCLVKTVECMNLRVTVVVGGDGSDNSVVKLFNQL
jgi:6-phosphofructokinase